MAKESPSPAEANLPFRFLRVIGRGLLRSLFHIEIDGLERLPEGGGYVLTCNHLSWIDPLVLMAHLPAAPRVHYLAAAEYTTEGPWLVRKVVDLAGGIIPVDRQSHRGSRAVVVQSLQVLKGGGVLGIFPEGKCGTEEGCLQPLKDGAALFAARTGRPVQILGISGTVELYFRKRIRVRVGPLLEPRPDEPQDELLARVEQAMAETIPPLDPGQPRVKLLTWLNRIF
ncbi:MAG: phospholipid/glycerol acyltransferase [Symbiobacteriaceae bacterium]|jgi:1-acyl-sn-glycerol-3-phosphate acyltransferase|nr:phospholipid/glycerol acyltransferase [Symbiobacteriaceae bacterium]